MALAPTPLLHRLRPFVRLRYVAPAILFVLISTYLLSYDALPNSFDLKSKLAWHTSREIPALQQAAYDLHNARRPKCEWTPWHEERYASLSTNQSDSNIFIAMNFYENEEVLPNFMQEFPRILQHLGPKNVYVSVMENGSKDKTPALLAIFDELLEKIGTPHTVIALGQKEISHKEDGHRISVLADARNRALAPLYSGTAARKMPKRKFDEMLFMNDVIHCSADVFELLYQKRLQGANQACGTDWGGWGGPVIYDRWILRSMSGKVWYHYKDVVRWTEGSNKPAPPLPDPEDAMDRDRFLEQLPLQVFSCWNGATVFDADAFLAPHNIRFRVAKNDLDEHGQPKNATDKASECFLTSVDLWKEKMGKVLLVPKSVFTYGVDEYNKYRKDGPLALEHDRSTELIHWNSTPPAKVAMQDFAVWYYPERWAPWDEA